jgi:aspartate aminotransferase-like enzyme
MYVRKSRLLTPGPTPLLPAALRAMSAADLHHRTKEFRSVYSGVIEDLHYFMGTKNGIALFASSGSGAMEAAVSNLFSPGNKVVVCVAGKFGERWLQIGEEYGLDAVTVRKPYGESVAPEEVRSALSEHPDAQGVLVQSTESSTGISHDVEAMGEIVGHTDAILVVDAITGLGSSTLRIDDWGLDVVIGGSQKALMIPPGLAYCSVSDKAMKRAETATNPNFYFNLRKHIDAGPLGDSPWTPASSLILGLAESLRFVKEVGRDRMIQNAQLLARAARKAARAVGLELFVRDAIPAGAVTAIRPPDGMDSDEIVRGFRERFQSIVANGQGSMKGKIFRFAHLGYFDFHDLFATIAELEMILHLLGREVELGSGVEAAQAVYLEAVASEERGT